MVGSVALMGPVCFQRCQIVDQSSKRVRMELPLAVGSSTDTQIDCGQAGTARPQSKAFGGLERTNRSDDCGSTFLHPTRSLQCISARGWCQLQLKSCSG